MVRLTHSGKRLFKNLKILFKFLKSNKLRKPRSFVQISWSIWQGPRISGESTRYQNRNWWQGWRSNKLRKPRNFVPITRSIWQGPRISRESTRYQNRNWWQGWRSNKLRKPNNFVPITWSIWQGPRISREIEFSTFDNSANRPVRYFSCWNRLSERRQWINWNRWPMVYILRKIPLCKSGSGSLFTFPSPP